MKIVKVKFRTPGIFLTRPDLQDPQMKLTFWLEVGGNWVNLSDVASVGDIKVLGMSNRPTDESSIHELPLETRVIEVPFRGEDSDSFFEILVPEGQSWNYRIYANPCVDCARLLGPESVDERGVIVGKGTIKTTE